MTKIQILKEWFKKYDRHLSSAALAGGFIVDAFTLRRVDLLFENVALITYFVIVGVGIVLLNIIDTRKHVNHIADNLSYIIPLLIQFAFGGLFSGFTIFYFRSGSLAASWPFIIILFSLLLGNELLRKQYARLIFQVTTLFTALFFFMIFFIPVLLDKIGPWIFILSGVAALTLTALFVFILFHFVPERVTSRKQKLAYWIASVYILINVLYFTNLIPPIPLSLKASGVYHSLEQQGGRYVAQEEQETYFGKLQFFKNIHTVPGAPLYVYSAVFAPSDLTTEVVHHWRHFDETVDRWVSINKIPYTIVGGSDLGHRGYSFKQNLSPGLWAVDVETPRGQVIGRITFEIIYVTDTPMLEEKTL